MPRVCVDCRRAHPDEESRCPLHGTELREVSRIDPELGQVLGNHVVLERLATGGSATVFRALRRSDGAEEALKVSPPTLWQTDRDVERFLRSAELARRLEGEGIVRVFDYGQEPDGTCWLAMERLEGRTLEEAFGQDGLPFPVARVLDLGAQILDAVQRVHDGGLVHRDLKPGNVFLLAGTPERVRLLDFGLVRHLEDHGPRLTLAGTALGTPLYMSPEQGRGLPGGVPTDLYAVGVILFEMITGETPHQDSSAIRLLLKKNTEEAPRIGEVAPDRNVPRDLEDLVSSLLDRDPSRRPTSAARVRDRLRQIAAALPAREEGGAVGTRKAPESKFRRPTRPIRGATAGPGSLRAVRFSPRLRMGDPELDAHHEHLCEVANEVLGQGLHLEAGRLDRLLGEVSLHAGVHFRQEEALMDRISWAEGPIHREAHVRLEQELESLLSLRRARPDHPEVGERFRLFLMHMMHHVQVLDAHLAESLQRDPPGPVPEGIGK